MSVRKTLSTITTATSIGPADLPVTSRRRFLRDATVVGVTVSGASTLSACGFFSTDADSGDDDSGEAEDGAKEAPSLAQQVEDGTLPPLEERLPTEPLVVEPVEEIGTYGGTWRTYFGGPDDGNAFNPINYEGLVRWAREYTGAVGLDEIIPNLATFEVSEDGSSYTFHLLEGVKWSDGEPFTADDIMFWYEAVLLNETVTPAAPPWLTSGGETVAVERVDDYTVTFTFATPKAFFLHSMAHLGEGVKVCEYPRHYLEQFHPDHNDDAEQAAADAGYDDWVALFDMGNPGTRRHDTNMPRLTPWVMTDPPNSGSRAVAERNPYYWKVDPEGKQLPYLDEVVYALSEDPEVSLLRALDGEVDLEHRHLNQGDNYPLVYEGQEDGDYRLMTYNYDSMNIAEIQLNLTHQDEVKREIFTDKDFRIGLSHAINRQEIIDLVYNGQGEPWQTSPLQETPFYHEQLATQYIEYDVDLANDHLDQAGYTERNGDGIRLGPDGEPIVINLTTRSGVFNWTDVGELLTDYFREVGVELRVDPVSGELATETRDSNQHDAVFGSGLGGRAALIVPWNYVPISPAAGFGVGWSQWYQGVPDAGEPPEPVRRQFELWDQVVATFDPGTQEELFGQILDIAAEGFYQIGIATPRPEFAVVKNSMRNVPDEMPSGSPYPNPAPYNPEHFFKDE
ncbi:ABC transporter substrate-binding protein [Phytoactinopolyspora halotolerans]|uniref:ABC transporter substrate-binding protein n=1 Tax=Phytoactinopolyspora halotolerans TaxID=1981512 RepID=A0A6L9S1L9_9ACTN|nr:ABC transporter substrate-binding protein [Phytoactinopolyspora halotolerans]NED98888.1 ABC transporter substrate-binding protein [Phytoactinopolyspora halotolerans]